VNEVSGHPFLNDCHHRSAGSFIDRTESIVEKFSPFRLRARFGGSAAVSREIPKFSCDRPWTTQGRNEEVAIQILSACGSCSWLQAHSDSVWSTTIWPLSARDPGRNEPLPRPRPGNIRKEGRLAFLRTLPDFLASFEYTWT